VFTWGGLQRRYLALTRSSIMLICFGVGKCCKLLSCLKFARLTKASVLLHLMVVMANVYLGLYLIQFHPGLCNS
jgi:hypothetical protein